MSITTKQLDITVECGADFYMSFLVRDDGDALVDLTGATVSAHLREYAEAQDYFAFTAVHNGAGGKVTLTMPHEDTSQIGYSAGVYDVFVTFPDTTVEKYMMGSVTVEPNVTKPVDGTVMYLLSFASEDYFPLTGLLQRLYFSHASNKMYRWNGSAYISIITDGEAATVEVGTVTTLPAGSSATVVNSGSLNNAKFDFGIPKGDPGTTSWDDIEDKPATFPPEAHNHDDRYYTEGETDTLLAEKEDISNLKALAYKDKADFYDDIDNLPSGYPPSPHDHDDRYYTEGETNTLLSGKSNTGHSHTMSDVTDLPTLGTLASQNTVDWDTDIDDIPSEFPPESHTHTTSDITDFPTLGTMSAEDDADSDNKIYGRQNGAWTDLAEALDSKADIITRSVSADLVHIEDGAPRNVSALSVSIEPVQDLHGYDAPWPAGGGKNLVDVASPQTITAQTELARISTSEQTQFTVSATIVNNVSIAGTLSLYAYNGNTLALAKQTVVPASASSARYSATIDLSSVEYTNLRIAISGAFSGYSLTVSDVQLEKGSTVTAFAPYSNICPISGHTQAVVTRTGKNLLNPDTIGLVQILADGTTRYGWEFTKAGTYTAQCAALGYGQIILWKKRSSDGTFSSAVYLSTGSALTTKTDIINNGERILVYTTQATANDSLLAINATKTMLEVSAKPTAYESYTGTTVTIPLGQTVYGGTVDVLTGTMTVTHKQITVNSGAITYSGWRFRIKVDDYTSPISTTVDSILCDKLKTIAKSTSPQPYSICGSDSDAHYIIFSVNSGIDTETAVNNWLAQNPLTIVYPLATPIVITGLTPAQMSTLLGTNNVWASTGATSLTYRADTKMYIDQQIAESAGVLKLMLTPNIETSMKASKNYTSGSIVIVGNTFLKLTSNVSNGSNLTIGSNCQKTTMAEWVASIV